MNEKTEKLQNALKDKKKRNKIWTKCDVVSNYRSKS